MKKASSLNNGEAFFKETDREVNHHATLSSGVFQESS
jgi:hypothetical protein